MVTLPEIRGLKFPDIYVVRFFFKERFDQTRGKVLELGCGNGNNLMLFYQYGWDVVGIDLDEGALGDAEKNFQQVGGAEGRYSFLRHDLNSGLPEIKGRFDVVLMPSVLYYIPRSAMVSCLQGAKECLKPDGSFFLIMRTFGDYRFGRGRQFERNGFILDISETGELGLINVFYHQYELIDMLREHLRADISSLRIFQVAFGNLQNDVLVTNHDIVIWGEV